MRGNRRGASHVDDDNRHADHAGHDRAEQLRRGEDGREVRVVRDFADEIAELGDRAQHRTRPFPQFAFVEFVLTASVDVFLQQRQQPIDRPLNASRVEGDRTDLVAMLVEKLT